MDSLTNPGFTHCDGEHGVMELGPDFLGGYVYTSMCSVPERIWEEVGCIRETHSCPCGCPEPGFGHPCIGHDEATGRVLEGPASEARWFQVNRYRETVWIEPAPEPAPEPEPDPLEGVRGDWDAFCYGCSWSESRLMVQLAVNLGRVHWASTGHETGASFARA